MREMTITVDDGLYETLRPMVEQRTIGDLLAAFAQSRSGGEPRPMGSAECAAKDTAAEAAASPLPSYTEAELEAGYRAMAADEEREREAQEWLEGLIGDIGDEEE
jgi:hypothetical protein